MSWKNRIIKDYFEANKSQISYTRFLNQVKEEILKHLEPTDDLAILDGQLFGLYKASVPHEAHPSAFKRLNSSKFWDMIQAELDKNLNEDILFESFQNSAIELLDTARATTTSSLKRRLQQPNASSPATPLSAVLPDDPFVDESPEERVRSKIIGYRAQADNRANDTHKQDLLAYGILDFISSSATKLKDVVDPEDLKHIVERSKQIARRTANDIDGGNHRMVREFAVEVMGFATDANKAKEHVQQARRAIRREEGAGEDYAWRKRAIKVLKKILSSFSRDGSSELYRRQSESHFIVTFLGPLFMELMKKHTTQYHLQWGDEALSQEKEAKQRTQKDDERRASAKMPDACLAFNKYNMSFLLLEVSGPPNKENHQHFVGDRVKIARQLKEILKSIRLTIANGDDDLYAQIKIYGIQVYLNKMYVYCLHQPLRGIYFFEQVLAFELACAPGLVSSFGPKLLANLWKLKRLICDSALSIDDYLNSEEVSSDDNSEDSRDTPYVSPKKQKTKK